MALTPDWARQAAFIVCGGPSVREQNLELLRGRRVIVINRSFETIPWADILFFADANPWKWYRDGIMGFRGRVVTVFERKPSNKYPDRFEQYRKTRPPALSRDPACITMQRTSVTGSIHAALHLGARPIVTLGLDLKAAIGKAGSKITHHHAPHPKPFVPGCWEKHRKELHSILPSLKAWGAEVWNASPGSACDAFPIMSLEDAIARIDMAQAA